AGQRVVEVAGRIALGRDDADTRFIEDAELRPHDGQVIGIDRAECVLPDGQRADLPAPDPAADLAAVLEVDDLAAPAQADAPGKERPAVLAEGIEARNARLTLPADSAEFED